MSGETSTTSGSSMIRYLYIYIRKCIEWVDRSEIKSAYDSIDNALFALDRS